MSSVTEMTRSANHVQVRNMYLRHGWVLLPGGSAGHYLRHGDDYCILVRWDGTIEILLEPEG